MSSVIQGIDGAISIVNATEAPIIRYSQENAKTSIANTYLGLLPGTRYSVIRDNFGDVVSVISSNGEMWTRLSINGVGTDFELFNTYLNSNNIPYNIPPPTDLLTDDDFNTEAALWLAEQLGIERP
jgi:hypothetical protein